MRAKRTIFFSNPKVSSDKLITPHYEKTKERVLESKAKYILAIQDQMRLNFTHHKAKADLGTIAKVGDTIQYGLIQHSVLCVTDQNEPLGLSDVIHFDNNDFDVSIPRKKRAVEDKKSKFWIDGLKNTRKRLGNPDKRIITVADREGDFYEFLFAMNEEDEEFVIRAQHDRVLGEVSSWRGGKKLYDTIEQTPFFGSMNTIIQDVNTREIKEITLQLKKIPITLPIPYRIKSEEIEKKKYKSINLNLVVAYNDDHQWILITSLPIDTIEQVQEIVTIYKSRWHIEDYHKVLKTGYQVDEIYLHTSKETIKNLLVMASISACRLYWLIYVGRTEATVSANQLFEDFEWKAIYIYFNEDIPDECPSISEIVLKIARLGGYKPNVHPNPPGIKTLWIGYQQLTIAAQVYRNMTRKT